MKAYEGRYDEKYAWLKSMGGFFFDDILRFSDYFHSRCPFSHYPVVVALAKDEEKRAHHGSIRTSETFMHGFRFWHHQDISTHISSLCRAHLHFAFFSLHLMRCGMAVLALDDKSIFFFFFFFLGSLFAFDAFPSFDLNILGKQRRNGTVLLYPHYLCTDTHALVCL